MSNNALQGTFTTKLKNWTDLTGLDLSKNKLQGPIPSILGNLKKLKKLKLDNNQFTGQLPEELTSLQHLKHVDFSSNNLDSISSKFIFLIPFGNKILKNNPCSNQFIEFIKRTFIGNEFDIKNMPLWLSDSLNILECGGNQKCEFLRSEAGFITVKGINVIYSKTICNGDIHSRTREVTTKFYDNNGNILETILSKRNGFFSSSGIVEPGRI